MTRSTTVSPTVRVRTAMSLIMSRMIETSKGSSTSSRTTVMTISEPTGPRIISTASSSVRPSTLSPSTWVMKSPGSIPALSAGVSSMGETTLTKPSSCVTSIPRPPNSPWVWVRMSSKSSSER